MQSSGVSMVPGVRWDGISKTEEIHPTMVATYVQRGWVILMSYSARDDLWEDRWENGYNNRRVKVEYRPVVLMGQMNLDAVREENVALAAQNRAYAEDSKQHAELRKKHEELMKRVEHLKMMGDVSEKSVNESRTKFYAAETLKQKLEVDIGKIRTAIGDLKMREILGEKAAEKKDDGS